MAPLLLWNLFLIILPAVDFTFGQQWSTGNPDLDIESFYRPAEKHSGGLHVSLSPVITFAPTLESDEVYRENSQPEVPNLYNEAASENHFDSFYGPGNRDFQRALILDSNTRLRRRRPNSEEPQPGFDENRPRSRVPPIFQANPSNQNSYQNQGPPVFDGYVRLPPSRRRQTENPETQVLRQDLRNMGNRLNRLVFRKDQNEFPAQIPIPYQPGPPTQFAMSNIFNPENVQHEQASQKNWAHAPETNFPPENFDAPQWRPTRERRPLLRRPLMLLEPAFPDSEFNQRFTFSNQKPERPNPKPSFEPGYGPVGNLRQSLYETSKLSGSSHGVSNEKETESSGLSQASSQLPEPGYGAPDMNVANTGNKFVLPADVSF